MYVLQLNKVTLTYPGREVFRDLIWGIDERDRIGLVGPNGEGKSSLLKIMAGVIPPESGAVTRAKGVRVGYLPQDVVFDAGQTVADVAYTLPPALAAVEARLSRVEAGLADPSVYNDANALQRQLAEQERVLAEFERLGGVAYPNKIRELLTQFGFRAEDQTLDVDALSGGQKKLLALARLAAESPELLILDEPDNHIDLVAKGRLEAFIRGYAGAVIIVSHDRYLLDEAVTSIVELDKGQIEVYPGNYSQYTVERELRRQRQQQLYVAQQKRVAQIEAAIHEFEMKARADLNERHARQAASRRKMLARMEASGELVDKVVDRKQLNLQMDGWRGSTKALEIKGLEMAFDDDLLFYDLNLLVRHGERVGLVGPNGAGKSVLFSLILGEREPLAGEIKIGPSVRTGHYAQEHQTLAPWLNKTPVEFVRDVYPCSESVAVNCLLRFLFTYEQTRQPIGTLSGGERSRLQLAALILTDPNLLLLDEPTNNLDIPSAEALETALEPFEGSALIISHDRYFLDRVADRIVELDDGTLRSYEGNYTDYVRAKERLQAHQKERTR